MTDEHPTDDFSDPQLRHLLSDAVSDVEPRDALPDIRSALVSSHANRPQETLMARSSSTQSSWTYALTGALLAAAVIAAVFLLFGNPMGTDDPGPAAGDTTETDEGSDKPDKPGTSEPTPVATSDPSQEPGAPAEGEVAAVYYVGVTPDGPRLFREFQKAPGADSFERALYLLQNKPLDPDYRPLWPEGSLADAVFDGDVIHVAITSPEYRMIPAGVDEATAKAAVESVIYTLQGAAQERAPVQFRFDGNPVDQVYGVATSEPLANGPILETLNHVSITEPAQAATYDGEMAISGVGNSFEANIVWKLLASGGDVVDEGFVTAEGWMEEKLFPWSGHVDLSGLKPGTYTFVAQTDDPSGGAEGNGPAVDTKQIRVG